MIGEYFYEIANYLPEEVLSYLIESERDEDKKLYPQSIKDLNFILDLFVDRTKSIPFWLDKTLRERKVLLKEHSESDDNWLCLNDPFRRDEHWVKELKDRYMFRGTSDYDLTTLGLMWITEVAVREYLLSNNMVEDHEEYCIWWIVMSTIITMFNHTLDKPYTESTILQVDSTILEMPKCSEVIAKLNIKIKTGDLV